MFVLRLITLLLSTFSLGLGQPAQAVMALGDEFEGVDVKNKLGESVDTNIPLLNGKGESVTLANYLDGERPVVFTLNFFRCASVCSAQLNSLVTTLTQANWSPGKENFRIVTVSFDPRDTTEIAASKQETYRRELVRALAESNGEKVTEEDIIKRAQDVDWTFLVARQKAINALLDNVGYQVRYDPKTEQYAHSPVTYVLTPDGRIGRYLWNLFIPPTDLKFALMESSNGKLGNFGDKVLLSCFVYEEGGYSFAWRTMRIGGALVVLFLGLWLYSFWRREKRRQEPSLSKMNHSESRV